MAKTSVPIRAFCILATACLVAPAAFGQSADAETRIALIIGNGDYANVPLKNPANDARDLAESLTGLGFQVSLVVDGDIIEMNRAIRDFGYAIKRPDAIALFYYSGHGVQYRGANYLIPAGSDIREADELPYAAINAEQVFAKMESAGARTNIIVLDACRNNPYPGAERAGERGLAVVGNIQPPQSLIVYSTAPGKTAQDGEGRNGVFTGALLDHLADPGLDIELMIRRVREDVIAATGGVQVPWHNSSLTGTGFAFAAPLPPAPAEPAPEPPAAPAVAIAPARAAAPDKPTGALNFVSDPPGVSVIVDGGETYQTPFSLELAPGAHSFEPIAGRADRRYVEGEPKQWITVAAGVDLDVPLRPKVSRAKLAFKWVPEGYDVYVEGEYAGTTPLDPLEVDAGGIEVNLSSEDKPPLTKNLFAPPGQTAVLAWGTSRDLAIALPRKTIKLDGKSDSWEGVEPLWELAEGNASFFMRQEEFGIKRIFICKDEKFLYWRVDFNKTNPLYSLPKGAGNGILLQISPWMEGAGRNFDMNVNYNNEAKKTFSDLGYWDNATQKWRQVTTNVISTKQAKDMFTAKLELSWLEKYCVEPGKLDLNLIHFDRNWQGDDATKVNMKLGYVDFLK
jgi:hypothetical protein